MKKNSYFLFIILIGLFSCTPSRMVRPLEKGQKTVSAHLGGPLIGFAGTTIPIPFTTVHYAQGISNKTTGYGSVHTTALLFGIFQTDIGVCQQIYFHDSLRIGLSVNPALNIAFDKWEKQLKCWPQLDINAYWEIKSKKSFVYAGIENWFELATYKAHGIKQEKHWIIAPQVGYTYVRKKWNYSFETKYIAPTIANTPNVVDYKGLGGRGTLGAYISFTRKF